VGLARVGGLRAAQEEEFEVYEPYCANYTNASELMVAQEQNLMVRRDIHFFLFRLSFFLDRDSQRVTARRWS
jgi:cell division control protein 24